MLGALVTALVLLGRGPAFAQQTAPEYEDDTFQQKVMKGVLRAIGVDVGQGRNIDYRERAPLVIPPNADLPPPETAAATPPDWPKDAAQRTRKRISAKKKDAGGAGATASAAGAVAGPATGPADPNAHGQDTGSQSVLPSALGESSKWIGNLFGRATPESTAFHGEPLRSDLTDPPSGYQIPSPSYPYGIGGTAKSPSSAGTVPAAEVAPSPPGAGTPSSAGAPSGTPTPSVAGMPPAADPLSTASAPPAASGSR